ncbi:hypothetical protein [Phaeodactylibacter xiamenensis]|uniref:hypothetical protein n=1 Tax=Phaeodactylibacter xiamenensis TaxID=1524460 RepID=UPI003BAC4F50
MKTLATLILTLGLTCQVQASARHIYPDTARCDTLEMRAGFELYAKVIKLEEKAYVIQYCKDERKSRIPVSKIHRIRYADGTVKSRKDIRREAWPKTLALNTTLSGFLQLLWSGLIGLSGLYLGALVLAVYNSWLGFPILIITAIFAGFFLVKGLGRIVKGVRQLFRKRRSG